MTLQKADQLPISLDIDDKRSVRTQFAALCYRIVRGKPEILLITSRETGRWIIPKGWPMEGKTPGDCALAEAWEEAGVTGHVTGPCLGLYTYMKSMPDSADLPCAVMVFPVLVDKLSDEYPEVTQRRRKWMRRKKAADRIDEAELSHMIRHFEPTSRTSR